MAIFYENNKIKEVYFGSNKIKEIYLGNQLVYKLNTAPVIIYVNIAMVSVADDWTGLPNTYEQTVDGDYYDADINSIPIYEATNILVTSPQQVNYGGHLKGKFWEYYVGQQSEVIVDITNSNFGSITSYDANWAEYYYQFGQLLINVPVRQVIDKMATLGYARNAFSQIMGELYPAFDNVNVQATVNPAYSISPTINAIF